MMAGNIAERNLRQAFLLSIKVWIEKVVFKYFHSRSAYNSLSLLIMSLNTRERWSCLVRAVHRGGGGAGGTGHKYSPKGLPGQENILFGVASLEMK